MRSSWIQITAAGEVKPRWKKMKGMTGVIPALVILRAGCLVPAAEEKFGTYHDVFFELFTSCLRQKGGHPTSFHHDAGFDLEIVSFNVVQSELEPIEYPSSDLLERTIGILISGSASNAFEELPWINELTNFTKKMIDEYPGKLFGICFGHQIISRALGATVARNTDGWELGVGQIELTEFGRLIFQPNEDESDALDPMNLFQVHRDIVTSLPSGTYNLGTSERCKIQGLVKFKGPTAPTAAGDLDPSSICEKIRIFTIQAHPEYNHAMLADVLDARTRGGSDFSIVDRDTYLSAKDSLARFPNPSDLHGSWIAFKIIKILNIL